MLHVTPNKHRWALMLHDRVVSVHRDLDSAETAYMLHGNPFTLIRAFAHWHLGRWPGKYALAEPYEVGSGLVRVTQSFPSIRTCKNAIRVADESITMAYTCVGVGWIINRRTGWP